MDGLYYFGYFLARRAPILLLILIGIAIALIRWKRHRKVSLITAAALSFLLIEGVVYALVLYQLPLLLEKLRIGYESQEVFYTILYVLDDIAYALVIALLVTAAFSQRPLFIKASEFAKPSTSAAGEPDRPSS